MSATHLPENVKDWPDDPYAILGVRYGTTPRDVRRAYTQLIRSYKPEQTPEEFRRIREAYETVLRHAEFFGLSQSVADAEALPPENGKTPTEKAPAPVPARRGPDLLEQMQAQWELAYRGQEGDAYQGLRELHEQHPDEANVCLRLYWLLAVAPEVDSLRKPCDWLLAGLRVRGNSGPLWELCRRELSANPEEAVGVVGTALLSLASEPARAVDVAEWRWLAAARLQRWELIGADVEALREPFSRADPEAWVHLLLSAVEHLTFVRAEAVRERVEDYRHEIQQHDYLHTRLGREFDRLDHLQTVAAEWHRLVLDRRPTRLVGDLVALGWGRPSADIRPHLDAFLAEVARQPRDWLKTLTRVHEQAPAVLDIVRNLLHVRQSECAGRAYEQGAREGVSSAIADFLDLHDRASYGIARQTLLDFCLEEAIAPDVVASAVEDRQDLWLTPREHLSQAIIADLPLHCIWLAHRLFWA